mgnify:CR=1 FL=1|tara:strand:+ start:2237 stop:3550 length:1314 start_codon:yes stop_codon:yes gene_type:complete
MATPLEYSLRLLSNLSESAIAERLQLRDTIQQLVYKGTREGARVGKTFQRRFKDIQNLVPGQTLQKQTSSPSSLFDLNPTEEQQMLQEMLKSFATDVMRPHAEESEKQGRPSKDYFHQLQELGLPLLAIPEALGGAGQHRTPLTSALLAESLSYGDMGLALASLSTLGFINAVTEYGSLEQQGRYLPALAKDEPLYASLALMEPKLRFTTDHMATIATPTGQGFLLKGEKNLVVLHDLADVFLVFAECPGHGPRAFFVEANTPGVHLEAESTMGLQNAALGRLRFQDVALPKDALLGEGNPYHHPSLVDLSKIGLCALAVGTCRAILEYVIDYCNARVAFGEPISHKQAVAFMIAEMAIELEGMQLLTLRAASRAEQGLDFHKEAYLAHIQCIDKGMQIGTNGVQLLGGAGFVCDHPIERWYRQIRAIGVLQGSLPV